MMEEVETPRWVRGRNAWWDIYPGAASARAA